MGEWVCECVCGEREEEGRDILLSKLNTHETQLQHSAQLTPNPIPNHAVVAHSTPNPIPNHAVVTHSTPLPGFDDHFQMASPGPGHSGSTWSGSRGQAGSQPEGGDLGGHNM